MTSVLTSPMSIAFAPESIIPFISAFLSAGEEILISRPTTTSLYLKCVMNALPIL